LYQPLVLDIPRVVVKDSSGKKCPCLVESCVHKIKFSFVEMFS